ncbi:MAG: YtxH domain-containing protein [Arenimonas sp.]|jgi:gas vesicle protein|nr:YtxH domain-containing protein [Arenimonas sp.]
MDKNPSNTLLALLAGVAIGAGLGILFAPDSGEKTRRKIKDGIDEAGDELQQQLHTLSQKIRTSVAGKGEQLSEQLDGLAAEASEETELMVGRLEARLAQLKERLAQKHT